jgi:hypothetical protein
MSLPELAARLVALLEKIITTEFSESVFDSGFRIGLADSGSDKVTFYPPYPPDQIIEAEAKEYVRKRDDKQYRQSVQREELTQLAESLAPDAKRLGVDWSPVISLSVHWKLRRDDIEAAQTQAAMLEALSRVPADRKSGNQGGGGCLVGTLAADLGVSAGTLNKLAREAGVPTPKRGGRNHKFTDDECRRIREKDAERNRR